MDPVSDSFIDPYKNSLIDPEKPSIFDRKSRDQLLVKGFIREYVSNIIIPKDVKDLLFLWFYEPLPITAHKLLNVTCFYLFL